MVEFDGVWLKATSSEELHEFARKMGVSRSWYSVHPVPHYEVICAFRHEAIVRHINKREKIKNYGQ
jgi:hypothetical protein